MKTKVPSFIIKLDSNGLFTSESSAFNNTKVFLAGTQESAGGSGDQIASNKFALSENNGQFNMNRVNISVEGNKGGSLRTEDAGSGSSKAADDESAMSADMIFTQAEGSSDNMGDAYVVISSKYRTIHPYHTYFILDRF